MGLVFRAVDRELGEPVAVKFLDIARPTPAAVEQFRTEVRAARRVTHRNVARIHDIGEAAGKWFLTMQLVDGASLRRTLEARGGKLPVGEAIDIAIEICDGIAAAHDAGVIHMDLKPENVMLARGGGVVVVDFGVARLAGVAAGAGSARVVAGTPGYMAPEQRHGDPCDARTDLYALGVTLYEMIAGARPPAGDAPAPAGASPTLGALLASLLAIEPDDRVPTARAVADALAGELGRAPARPLARAPATLRLAVLPFRDGDGLTEELADRLGSLQGATVLAASTTAALAGVDPREAGAKLGVDAVVEGSVRRGSAGELVVGARLVDTATGAVAWSERFEGAAGDVLHLNEQLARRIAEGLRVELGALPHRGHAPDDAIAGYMHARGKLARVELWRDTGAIAELDRVVAAAPDFLPAVALRALAYARGWFTSRLGDEAWHARAARAIADAQSRARGFPETELAAGVLAWQTGELAAAVEHFAHTLDAAPSQPLALEYLGRLLCEAGRPLEGARHVALAGEIDPRMWLGRVEVARHHALHRCWPEYDAELREVAERGGTESMIVHALELRVAAWRGATDAIVRAVDDVTGTSPLDRMYALYGAVQLGGAEVGELEAVMTEILEHAPRRFTAYAHQVVAEAIGARGEGERTLGHLEAASAAGLVDLEWLDVCPLLHCARAEPGFAAVRRAVRARANALWH